MNEHQTLISNKIKEIMPVADNFPGVIIIHNIQAGFNKVEYMSPRGTEILKTSLEEIQAMGADYYPRFFNEEDAKDYVPKMIAMMERNNENEVYSFFQQVRPSAAEPWTWYSSSSKILLKDPENKPLLLITFAVPIDPQHHLTNKVSRLLEENNFLRLHFKEFSSLSAREREVMKLLANGSSTNEVSETLHISLETTKTHRKNIYRKLHITSSFELSEYARAFDLL